MLLFLFSFKDENVSSTVNNPTSQGSNAPSGPTGETSGKWFSVSARRAGAGTAYPNDRGGARSSGYGNRSNDMRKQGFISLKRNSSNSLFFFFKSFR